MWFLYALFSLPSGREQRNVEDISFLTPKGHVTWVKNKLYLANHWDFSDFFCYHNIIFFPFIFISWRLITLQYCSGFCHTLTWISHGFTCIPHPDPPCHLPLYRIPLGLPSAPGPSTCLMHPTWAGEKEYHNII